MQVSEVMTRGAECVRPNTPVREAARKMRDFDIGSLPVCGDDDRLAGVVTDRDITIRAVAEGFGPETALVADVMTEGTVCCFEDQDAAEAARLMRENQIRRLAVLDHEKHLVGFVSLGDLAVKTGDDRMSGEALEQVSEPAEPCR